MPFLYCSMNNHGNYGDGPGLMDNMYPSHRPSPHIPNGNGPTPGAPGARGGYGQPQMKDDYRDYPATQSR